MRKYTRPEMEYKVFETENVLTASGGSETTDSSAALLSKELTTKYGVAQENIVNDLW